MSRRTERARSWRAQAAHAVYVCVMLWASACGDSASGGGGPPRPVTEDNALSTLAGALCDRWFDCPCSERQRSWGNKTTCRELMVQRWESDLTRLAPKGFHIDTACVDAHLAALRTLACSSEPELNSEVALLAAMDELSYCHAITIGLAEGDSCKFEDTSHLSADGCGAGLRCDNQLCVARLPGDGEACTEDRRCSRGLSCNGDGRCELRVEEEAAVCECSDDAYCMYSTAAEPPTCEPRIAVGERCATGVCVAEAYCEWRTRTCVAYPLAGEACINDVTVPAPCAEGLYCRNAVCAALPGRGESCAQASRNPPCEEGLICRSSRTCDRPAARGEGCGDDSDCGEGLSCEDDVCIPHPPVVCD